MRLTWSIGNPKSVKRHMDRFHEEYLESKLVEEENGNCDRKRSSIDNGCGLDWEVIVAFFSY